MIKLKDIEQIGKGCKAFMPSGLIAELSLDPENPEMVNVTYEKGMERIVNTYSKEDFEKLVKQNVQIITKDGKKWAIGEATEEETAQAVAVASQTQIQFKPLATDINDLDIPQELADKVANYAGEQIAPVAMEVTLDLLHEEIKLLQSSVETLATKIQELALAQEAGFASLKAPAIPEVPEAEAEPIEETPAEPPIEAPAEEVEAEQVGESLVNEDLTAINNQVDKMIDDKEDVETIQAVVNYMADGNEQEKKQAKQHAVEKMKHESFKPKKGRSILQSRGINL